jgi:thiosulfate/3-mercaptopyruvate sulfurtransferase
MRCFALSAVGFVVIALAQWRSIRADEGAYPRADLLVEASQLAQPRFAAGFVILDARPRTKYEQGHIPQAQWVDHNQWATAFGHVTIPGINRRIGGLGIGAKTTVIVYDDMFNRDAARIWWILRYWGVDDVRLLNGGWKAWKDGNHSIATSETPARTADFVARPRPERLATKQQILNSLSGAGEKLQIIDARSEGEFCGTKNMGNKRAGAIPGAKQLEWVDLMDKQSHRFKSPDELRQLFAAAGVSLDRPSATHCQSGGRSSVMAFGMELMGAKDVSNYYLSWAEWGNADDTPVVPGKPKRTN